MYLLHFLQNIGKKQPHAAQRILCIAKATESPLSGRSQRQNFVPAHCQTVRATVHSPPFPAAGDAARSKKPLFFCEKRSFGFFILLHTAKAPWFLHAWWPCKAVSGALRRYLLPGGEKFFRARSGIFLNAQHLYNRCCPFYQRRTGRLSVSVFCRASVFWTFLRS